MRDAKDLARKIVQGCGHNAPVVVPCQDCVASQIGTWESEIRASITHELKSEWRSLIEDLRKSNLEVDRLKGIEASLRVTIAHLKDGNKLLSDRLQVALDDAANTRAQLHADVALKSEQAVRDKARVSAQ